MSEDNALVLVAGYQDLDSARHDFQTLVDAAKDKSIPLQGAVLIGKDAEGSPVFGGHVAGQRTRGACRDPRAGAFGLKATPSGYVARCRHGR